MESFFSRYKNALVLAIVLLAQLLSLAIQVKRPVPGIAATGDESVSLIRYWAVTLVTPPERVIHTIGMAIWGVWENYFDLVHVRQQNRDLQDELHRLRLEQGALAEDARQGQRLRELLSFEEKYVYKTVPAEVIGTAGTDQSHIVFIDKGSADGLASDMPVITPDGVVGRLREVFPHTSQVLELSDPTSAAGVILETTRIRGILRGNTLGQPQVVNISPDDRIKPGERVITSGGDQIYPRGLLVGTVERTAVDPDHDPLIDVSIRTAANLSQLEEVLVITSMGDQMPAQERLDVVQSEAAASVEQLRASDVLAERLPSRVDPDAPQTDEGARDETADGGIARPIRPLPALHPDKFSPSNTPPATELAPGQRVGGAPLQDSPSSLNRPARATVKPPSSPAPDQTENQTDDGDAVVVPKKPKTSSAATGESSAAGPKAAAGAASVPKTVKTTSATTVTKPAATSSAGSTVPGTAKPAVTKPVAPDGHAGSAATPAPVKRKGPEIVPPDGSEPPPVPQRKPAAPSQTNAPGSPRPAETPAKPQNQPAPPQGSR